MNADVVRVFERFIEGNILDEGLFFRHAAGIAQVFDFLDGLDVLVILIGGVVAKHVHVEAGALLDHGQANAAGADDGDRLAGDFVAQKRQVGMPIVPLVAASEVLGSPHFARQRAHHEEGEFGGGLGQNVGRVRKRDFVAVGVSAIDVVEADSDLGYDLQSTLAGFEDFGVDRVAQSRD